MRKFICLSSIIFIVITSSVFFPFCNKKVRYKDCSNPPNAVETATFEIYGESINSIIEIRQYQINGNNVECIDIKPSPNEVLFIFIKKYCNNNNIDVCNNTFAITLYYNSLINGNNPPCNLNLKTNYFPNPVKDLLHVEYYFECQANVTITLFDMNGFPVVTIPKGLLNKGMYRDEINCTALPPGMYVLMLNVGGEVVVRLPDKFVA